MIGDFHINDFGVIESEAINSLMNVRRTTQYPHAEFGIGTDATGALDDLLERLARHYDVSGVESRIREEWSPLEGAGDGDSTYYCIYLQHNESE